MENNDYLTMKQVCDLLGVSYMTLSIYIRKGQLKIKNRRRGRHGSLISLDEVADMLQHKRDQLQKDMQKIDSVLAKIPSPKK